MLNNDNEESRKMVEQCYKLSKTVINPIIDWADDDVWEFIHEYDVPYCKLYDEGYKRLGCIGCPMASHDARVREFEKYPKYKRAYIRAFQRMLDAYSEERLTDWETGEDVFKWWLRDPKGRFNADDSQINMENDDDK